MTDFTKPANDWMGVKWYDGFLTNLPDLCVGRLPPDFAPRRWKVWVVETPVERGALIESLAKPIPRIGNVLDFQSGPDAVIGKQGSGDSVIALYEPQEQGWPWIVVSRFPAAVGAAMGLQRGVYAIETDATEDAAHSRMSRLMLQLKPIGIPLKIVFPTRETTL